MSYAAHITVLLLFQLFGVVQESDEGAAAHNFQMPIVAQLPFAAFFCMAVCTHGAKGRNYRDRTASLCWVIAISSAWWLKL